MVVELGFRLRSNLSPESFLPISGSLGWDLIQVALSPGSKTAFHFLVNFLPGFPDPKNLILFDLCHQIAG